MTIPRPFLRIAAISGIFAASVLCGTAVWATGDVLLPSDNNSSGTLPNLGLTPASPDNTPPATGQNSPPPLPSPVAPMLPSAAGGYTPMVGSIPGSSPTPTFVAPRLPLQVIQQNAPSLNQDATASLNNVVDPVARQNLMLAIQKNTPPLVMHVSMAPQYVWGPADVTSVGVQIGIPSSQISSHCQMGARGTVTSDKGTYTFDTGAAGADDMHYDGTPSSILVMLQAMCDTAPTSGMVIQNGNKYQFLVRPLNCPPPPPGVGRLTIQYAGNGSGQCLYQ